MSQIVESQHHHHHQQPEQQPQQQEEAPTNATNEDAIDAIDHFLPSDFITSSSADGQNDQQQQEHQQEQQQQMELLDLRHPGSVDHCWKMVAQKITDATFWIGAELFLSVIAPFGGHQSVRDALARHVRHLFGVFLRWEDIFLVPSELHAVTAFSKAFCSRGDVLLCPAPFASAELRNSLEAEAGVELRPVQMDAAAGMELDLADLERERRRVEEDEGRRVRALLLHNPHPLLGSIRDGDRRLARLLEWTNERDLHLIVDESLASLDLWEFSSSLSLDHRGQYGQKLIWIWNGAKHLSLPGLEFAAIHLPHPTAVATESFQRFVQTHPCAPLVQFLTAKLLNDFDWCSELFARRKSRLDELRELAIDGLGELGIDCLEVPAQNAAQWLLMDLRKLMPSVDLESEQKLREEFAKKARILLLSGEQLGMAEPGWFQLGIGESERHCQEVLQRLRMVLEGKLEGSQNEADKLEGTKIGRKEKGRREPILWDNGRAAKTEDATEEEDEADIEERRRMEEEQMMEDLMFGGDHEFEPNEREWTMTAPSSSSHTPYSPTLEQRRLSLIREEEGEDELLKQVFTYEGREWRTRGGGGQEVEEEEEADEMIRKVFAIFPRERLKWKKPLVEVRRMEEEEEESVKKEEGKKEEEALMMKQEEMKEEGMPKKEEVKQKRSVDETIQMEEKVQQEEKVKMEVKSTREEEAEEEEDVRKNGLDAEAARQEEAHRIPSLRMPTPALMDFSFIEELVRSTEMEENYKLRRAEEAAIGDGDFYDEASTEEDEGMKEETKQPEEATEEYTQLSPSFTIDVPIRVDKATGHEAEEEEERMNRDFEDSSDSRRIIEIIDQIFQDAVQIRDFSSSSNDSHPNQAMTVRQPEYPSRSDSGLAVESPSDLSFSPLIFDGHQLDRIEERVEFTEYSVEILESPEPTRNEREMFGQGPIQTSTLKRREEADEEPIRHLGPTAQMLEDSGIFVEMPPGSLSIDFPLLVPVEHLKSEVKMEGMEEATPQREEMQEEKGLTIDLHFKTPKVEEERPTTRMEKVDDLTWIEEVAGMTTVQIRGSAGGEKEQPAQISWTPLESVPEEPPQSGTQRIRVNSSSQLLEEREEAEEEDSYAKVAAILNEGSAFCPTPSPREKEERRASVTFAIHSDGYAPAWSPLDELMEEAPPEIELKKGQEIGKEEAMLKDDRKFSDTLDELEAKERSRQGTFASEDRYKSSVEMAEPNVTTVEVNGNGINGGGERRRSREAIDIVAEWNAKRMEEKQQQQQQAENVQEEIPEGKWAAISQVIFDAIDTERGEGNNRTVEAWEDERKSKVEEVKEVKDDEERVKTVVKLEPPKQPRTTPTTPIQKRSLTRSKEFEEDEDGWKEGWKEERRREEPAHLKEEEELPEMEPDGINPILDGQSRAYQVHHRMQMRRRESSKQRAKRRHKSKERVILEHMNITEVDYAGGLNERIERGERLVTCISTRINQYTPDEYFRRLPFEGFPDLSDQRERLSKYVEVRRRRRTAQNEPDGREGGGAEIGRTETETVTIQRLDRAAELEEAKANEELHCRLEGRRMGGGGKEEDDEGQRMEDVYVTCRNPEHTEREDHCDPKRLYNVRRSTTLSENGYKKMKRDHEGKASSAHPKDLHSEFATVHYEMGGGGETSSGGNEASTVARRVTTKHRYRRPRRPRSPARITVTTTRGGGILPAVGGGGESIDRVTVRHTPGSNWIVSSIYKSTDYGWEKTALKKGSIMGAADVG